MKIYKFPYIRFTLTFLPILFFYIGIIFSTNYFFFSLLKDRDKNIDIKNLEVAYNPKLDISDLFYIDNKSTDCLYLYCNDIQKTKTFTILKDISFSIVGTYDNREFLFFDDLFLTNPKFYNFFILIFLFSHFFRKIHKYQFFYYEKK